MNDSISRRDRAFAGHICPFPRWWWPVVVLGGCCCSASSGVHDETESDQVPNHSRKLRQLCNWGTEAETHSVVVCFGWTQNVRVPCLSVRINFWQARWSPFVCKFIFRSQFVGIFWTNNLYMHKLCVPLCPPGTFSSASQITSGVHSEDDHNKLKFKINFSQFFIPFQPYS